ncbi:MAG: type II and III secretion system protein family protein [Nitrospiraceae bacterium]|nr:type II and III secretion system protein family protein [Nitrospira sp.]MCA9456210.1 type II and III secretion system protein family protein [Nitrospira sp.]MCB9773115.1 type II and III secretion system protein family protein [Nitrospiraceae bacterium]
MKQTHGFPFRSMVLALSLVLVGYTGALGEGLTTQAIQVNEPQNLRLTVGESKIVERDTAFKRASIANPKVADQIVLSNKQIYLTGIEVGTTTLTLWGQDGQVANVFQVQVSPDVTRLKEQLHTILPNEPGLQVMNSHEHISLTGNVSNMESLTKALTLAEPYAPNKVINLVQVGGVQQVMMEVKVAEMQRGLMKRLGVNFKRAQKNHRDFSIGLINKLSTIDAYDPFPVQQSSQTTTLEFPDVRTLASNLVLGFGIGQDLWTLFLDLLKEHSLSKTLAEPTLIAESGQAAEFLVGGEYPVPIPQQLGQVTIKYKEFGVGLKFTPTVLSEGRISVIVNPEVSELDFANGVQLNGFIVPALTTRRVKTVVELGDGQSFAIAGLLQDNIKETVSKYPFLGDIPVLGALFRSTSFQKNETELIVIVTPHLVKPLDMVQQTLPTDHYLEPNDFELMLMGYVEGVFPEPNIARPGEGYTMRSPSVAQRMPFRKGGMEGMFGHLAP